MSNYVKLPREKIKFNGNTKEEKKLNELVFDLSLENDALHQEIKELKEKLDIETNNYEIIYDYISQINRLLGVETCEEILEKINLMKQRIDKAIKKCELEIKASSYQYKKNKRQQELVYKVAHERILSILKGNNGKYE